MDPDTTITEVLFKRREKYNKNKKHFCQECYYSFHRCRCEHTDRNTYRRSLLHEGDTKYCQTCYYRVQRCSCPETVLFENENLKLVLKN